MSGEELMCKIDVIRKMPLRILCRLPDKRELIMTIPECRQRGGAYLHVVADELDSLLEAELGTPPLTEGREKGYADRAPTSEENEGPHA